VTSEKLAELRAESDRLMRLCGEEAQHYARRIEWETDHLAPQERRGMDRVIRKLEPISDLSPLFRELAFAPEICGPIAQLFAEPVDLFEDKLNFKLPGGSPYPWHQDWVCCWRAHTDRLVTCFIYLDDADAHNGCLQVIPGSHLGKPILPFRAGSRFEVDPASVDDSRAVPAPLKAGEMIFFDPYLLHYSDLNRSQAPRRAIIYTYYPASLGAINRERFPQDGK
jgi:ectoine hydroxylase-related dioxygenase (phytanoyl-CoA dioxygenase family)